MEQKRKYQKKNQEYWGSFGKRSDGPTFQDKMLPADATEPAILGEAAYVSSASYSRNPEDGSSRATRGSSVPYSKLPLAHTNIDSFALPFNYSKDGTASVKEPIKLCQKAYFHVPIFGNTINMLAELSCDDLKLSGGTKASRAFIKKWLKSIRVDSVRDQFFREYYRSGNIFLYRMFAEFSESEISSLKTIYAKNDSLIPQESRFPKNNLPMRYVLLNPMDIVHYEALGSSMVFKKILSKFEVLRLKSPQTEEDKRLAESVKKMAGGKAFDFTTSEIYIDLDPSRLIFAFYKKQDYEPFSIPLGYSVLRDINWKLELKKIDQSISRTLENIILLITMGNEPDKGGINPKNMEAMKNLFANESIGRVLVADYTTEAKFIIPDVAKILGSEKYEVVDRDIKEGLQNIFFEEAKYSNSEMKIKIFFEKLKEGKRIFINDFLQPEIEKVCAAIGFRDYPKISFKSSTMLTETEMQKLALRLTELGILHPEQGVKSILEKELPNPEEVGERQEEYRKQREDGQYVPLTGGAPLYAPVEEMKLAQQAQQKTGAPSSSIKKSAGRPTKSAIAAQSLVEIAKSVSSFESRAIDMVKKKKGLTDLSTEQKENLSKVCEGIVVSQEKADWEKTFEKCIAGDLSVSLAAKREVLDIVQEHNINEYEAALVYHSQK